MNTSHQVAAEEPAALPYFNMDCRLTIRETAPGAFALEVAMFDFRTDYPLLGDHDEGTFNPGEDRLDKLVHFLTTSKNVLEARLIRAFGGADDYADVLDPQNEKVFADSILI